jgi:hypothetical protein
MELVQLMRLRTSRTPLAIASHPSQRGEESSRDDHPAAADGETPKGHPGVGECGLGLIEGIPGDLRVEVIGAEGGSHLAPGQYLCHEEHWSHRTR